MRFCVLLLVLTATSTVYATGVDSTFGTNGSVILQLPGDVSSQATGATLQSDGKLVIVGTSPGVDHSVSLALEALDATRDFLVARFNADGSLDSGFGSGGITRIDFGHGDDRASSVIQQSDGKLLIIGQALSARGTDFDVALARLDSHGNLDTSFNGTGRVTINVPSVVVTPQISVTNVYGDNEPTAVAQQPDGKLLIAAKSVDLQVPWNSTEALTQVLRLMPDGSLDPTFGSEATGSVSIGEFGTPQSVVVEPSGRILLIVSQFLEMDPDGRTFSLSTPSQLTPLTQWFAGTCVLQPDGGLLLGGLALPPGGASAGVVSAVARMTSVSAMDPSFGTGGVTTNVSGGSGLVSRIVGLALEPSGNIIATGTVTRDSTHLDAAVTRLLPDGSFDKGFGENGILTVSFEADGQNSSFQTVASLRGPDGKLILVGNRGAYIGSAADLTATSKRIALTRLTSTPEYSVVQGTWNVSESAGSVNIRVTRSAATANAVSIRYETADDSAVAGTDYTMTSGTLTWQPGDTNTKTISVPIHDRSLSDGSKRQFSLQLSDPSEGSVSAGTATISIAEDDSVPQQKGGGGVVDWLTLSVLLGCGATMLRPHRMPLTLPSSPQKRREGAE
jgi:uncharacterized delta-60 repeat protein